LSRACLGKMIIFKYKWLKKTPFLRLFHFMHAKTRMRFAKTGSG
jgi:hypothetical protein